VQAYEESDAQRWAELEQVKTLFEDLRGIAVTKAEEWDRQRTILHEKLAESRSNSKHLRKQLAARMDQSKHSSARLDAAVAAQQVRIRGHVVQNFSCSALDAGGAGAG